MKAIQVTFDETLLARLDADDEVRQRGRSAVLRQATVVYLEGRRERQIADQYRAAYENNGGLGEDFDGWEDEGEWPPK